MVLREVLLRVAGAAPAPRAGPGAGARAEPRGGFPSSRTRSPAAASAEGGREARNFAPPPAAFPALSCPAAPGAGLPARPGGTRRRGGAASAPRQLSPASCGGRAALHRCFHTARPRECIWVSSSTVAFLFFASLWLSLSAPCLPFSPNVSVSTQFLSLCSLTPHPRSPGFSFILLLPAFLGMSLRPCYSLSPAPLSASPASLPFRPPLPPHLPSHPPRLVPPNAAAGPRDALARGAHPGQPSGHLQVQRPSSWEPEGTRGGAPPALVRAVKSGAECRARGPASPPGLERAAPLLARAHGGCRFGQREPRAPLPSPALGYGSGEFPGRESTSPASQAAGRQAQKLRGPVETNLERVGAFVRQRCH